MTFEQNPLRDQLTQLYDVLSHKIAGGQRVDANELLPGADDPLEGLIPDEFRDQVTELDWFTPSEWAGLGAEDALRADMAQIPEPGGAGVDGNGADFFRTGEAPDNFVNRHNPLYVARKDFIAQLAPKLNEMFGTSAGGVGYYRPPKASDKNKGGRSSNSDHYSAGAADFFGTTEQLDALRDYLVGQPWVSFVRWRSESHGGESGTEEGAHVHASFDLGWIARNYFQGRSAPTLPKSAPKPASTSSTPVQVADDANRAI